MTGGTQGELEVLVWRDMLVAGEGEGEDDENNRTSWGQVRDVLMAPGYWNPTFDSILGGTDGNQHVVIGTLHQVTDVPGIVVRENRSAPGGTDAVYDHLHAYSANNDGDIAYTADITVPTEGTLRADGLQ